MEDIVYFDVPEPRTHAVAMRVFGEREVCVIPRAYNTILTIGEKDESWGYDNYWCFATTAQAVEALKTWNPDDPATPEPQGWFRHAPSSRRRPDGNPDLEYIRR